MSAIGWGAGSPPASGGSYLSANSGSFTPPGYAENYFCGVEGAFTTASFFHVWTPTAGDPSPVVYAGLAYGGFVIIANPGLSGTLEVSALVDGVVASNTLVLVFAAGGYGYGTAAWASSGAPAERYIGWGTRSGTTALPGATGFSTDNADTSAPGLADGDAICGVIGAYSTVSFSHTWEPVIPGAPSPVTFEYSTYGKYYLTFNISNDRAAGTVRVSAVVDGQPAGSQCVLAVALNDWPVAYGSIAWTTELVDLPEGAFWTLFIGTEEA